jgi:hypothetical protein
MKKRFESLNEYVNIQESYKSDLAKVQKFAKTLETKIGAKLKVSYIEEFEDPEDFDKNDETKGVEYQVIDNDKNYRIEDDGDGGLLVHINLLGEFQFHYDAAPYSTKLNSEKEIRDMAQALNDYPKPIDKLTRDMYLEIVKFIQEQKD